MGVDVARGRIKTYMVSFPQVLKSVACPVVGCLKKVNNPGKLREHFMYCKWKSKVAIIQEGPEPLPKCDHCGMHMPADRPIKHIRMARCNKETYMQIRWRDVEMVDICGEMEFRLYRREGGAMVEGVEAL